MNRELKLLRNLKKNVWWGWVGSGWGEGVGSGGCKPKIEDIVKLKKKIRVNGWRSGQGIGSGRG